MLKPLALRDDIPELGVSSEDQVSCNHEFLHGNRMYEKIYHFIRKDDVPLHRSEIGVPYQDKSNI